MECRGLLAGFTMIVWSGCFHLFLASPAHTRTREGGRKEGKKRGDYRGV